MIAVVDTAGETLLEYAAAALIWALVNAFHWLLEFFLL